MQATASPLPFPPRPVTDLICPARANCFTNPKSIRAWINSEFGSEMAKDQ